MSYKDLTEEKLITLDAETRGVLIANALPGLVKDLGEDFKFGKKNSDKIEVQNTETTRAHLTRSRLKVCENLDTYYTHTKLMTLWMEEAPSAFNPIMQKMNDSLSRAIQQSKKLEVLVEHRDEFYSEFVKRCTPLAKDKKEIATFLAKGEKEVLKHAETALKYMVLGEDASSIPKYFFWAYDLSLQLREIAKGNTKVKFEPDAKEVDEKEEVGKAIAKLQEKLVQASAAAAEQKTTPPVTPPSPPASAN